MKPDKIFFCIAVLFITIGFNGCDDDDPWCWIMICLSSIRVENNTNTEIGVHVGFSSADNSFSYPDTMLPAQYPAVQMYSIPANDGIYCVDSRKRWEEIFELNYPADTLSLFFFSWFVTREEWDDVRDNYEILTRYDLSYHDLEKLNYTVPYPPSSEMNQMKIYIHSP